MEKRAAGVSPAAFAAHGSCEPHGGPLAGQPVLLRVRRRGQRGAANPGYPVSIGGRFCFDSVEPRESGHKFCPVLCDARGRLWPYNTISFVGIIDLRIIQSLSKSDQAFDQPYAGRAASIHPYWEAPSQNLFSNM